MSNHGLQFCLLDSLQKVFSDECPSGKVPELAGLQGERLSFQFAYYSDKRGESLVDLPLILEIKGKHSDKLKAYVVEQIRSDFPAYMPEEIDENYLRTAPGLYPDLLMPFTARYGQFAKAEDSQTYELRLPFHHWRSLWFELEIDHLEAGDFIWQLQARDKAGNVLWSEQIKCEVLAAGLPKQPVIHTEWFHADCLADYYGVEVFSEKHWQTIGEFMKIAAKHSINAILTPLFTLPLDTQIGGERTTHQLVDVKVEGESYRFGWDKLDRWVDLALESGIEYIEFSHLFTQWGAKHAPKIMAEEGGELKKIFGWETEATGPQYTAFLRAFLTELTKWIEQKGIASKVIFHISDEPHASDKEYYLKAKNSIADLLEGYFVTDALSDFELYKEGIVEHPVVSNDKMDYFIGQGAENLWTYYCCAQKYKVANRFFSMPSYRNRILGLQLYKFDVKGFLHWGYNFYNSQFSLEKINPFIVSDACEAFPSGDAFLVYPSREGKALQSIRLKVLAEAFYDYRALKYLESLAGREFTLGLIEECGGGEITFTDYPHGEQFILQLRKRVNSEIKARIS